jgi:hypothetical protein
MSGSRSLRWRKPRPGRPECGRCRAVLGWLFATFAVSQAIFSAQLERPIASLRDTEYALKFDRLLARKAEHPDRPLRLALGSSRVCMGLHVTGPRDNEPLVFNFGVIGAGAMQQALTFDRLLRAGVRPKSVFVEYWPPFMLAYPRNSEEARLDGNQLTHADLALVRRCVHDPDRVTWQWRTARLVPSYAQRFSVINVELPVWLIATARTGFKWAQMDDWGWKPACDGPQPPQRRAERLVLVRKEMEPCLQIATIDPTAAAAFAELFSGAKAAGIDVTVVWMPESSEFRAMYTPECEAISTAWFTSFRERYGVRLLDARRWMPDDQFYDGFHLAPDGAAAFTERLRAAGWW